MAFEIISRDEICNEICLRAVLSAIVFILEFFPNFLKRSPRPIIVMFRYFLIY